MSAPFETIFLRFRDLVTPTGGTIDAHRAIIADHGAVWWGWWNKAGERAPVSALDQLTARLHTSSVEVLLVDTGREVVLRATLVEVAWGAGGARRETPDKAATPAYYATQPYLIWFKFTAINDVSTTTASLLGQYSYVPVPEFFDDAGPPVPFADFDGKRLVSIRELRDQDRTIWFVRTASPGDPGHEILMRSPSTARASHFPGVVYDRPSSQHILWISDLHFGPNHAFPLTESHGKSPLWLQLEHALDALAVQPAACLISGDLTWSAEAVEFESAASLIGRIASKMRLDPYHFVVCPGNHDVRWTEDKFADYSALPSVGPDFAKTFDDFYEKLFYLRPSEFRCMGRRFLLGRGRAVEIAALDSVRIQQVKDLHQGFGWVGEDQLRHVAKQMGWKDGADSGVIRIVMLHHHLAPMNDQNEPPVQNASYSMTLDAGRVISWCREHGVRLVVHGHKHEPGAIEVTDLGGGSHRALAIVGMGSSGVVPQHTAPPRENTFALIHVGVDQIEISIHPLHADRPLAKDAEPLRRYTIGVDA